MEKKEKLVITLVVCLGLLSAGLGFACEILRIEVTEVIFAFDCEYPPVPALFVGLTAALALTISQIFLTAYYPTGCLCWKRSSYRSNSMSRPALFCFIFSWVAYIVALFLFVSGAAISVKYYTVRHDGWFIIYFCSIVNPAGVFTGASFMSIINIVLSILYIRKLNSAKKMDNDGSGARTAPNQVSNIAMGTPEIPTVIQDPVFVHEDTYIRRQLAQ